MKITCRECGTSFDAARGATARSVACPSCGRSTDVPATDELNLVGATFAGVEIDAVVARGSRSIIYRGRSPEIGRPVAVKVLTGEGESSPEELERFEREARAASRLRHPNIVTVHRVGREAGKPYIVMDFIQGRSLAVRTDAGPLPARAAMAITAALASAMEHAHGQGIIHRDLKPENILFDESGSPRIMDFGLARDVIADPDGRDTAGKIVGTPAYMSPEQAAGLGPEVDEQSDVHALGAILYEMLTGHPPFAAPTTALLLKKVADDEPPRPSSLNAEVHPDAETICLRAMERTRARRYASAEMLRRDAEAFLGGKRIAASPPGVAEKAPRWVRRHKVSAVAAVAALALVSAAAWLALREHATAARAEHDAENNRIETFLAGADASAERWRGERDSAHSTGLAGDLARERRGEELARALGLYVRAVAESPEPDRAAARRRLAEFVRLALADAEADGDLHSAALLRELGRSLCAPAGGAYFAGPGTLRIDSAPPGASGWLARYVEEGGRLVRESARALGPTPVAPVELEPGAYLLRLSAEGFAPLAAPVQVFSGCHRSLSMRMLKAADMPEGFVLVPRLDFPGPRSRGGFLMARSEVTSGEYAAFLASLAQPEAAALAPRPLPGGLGDRPVSGVTAEGARAYCRWLSARLGRTCRLPRPEEWSFAASGEPRQPYPWGHHFDAAWTVGGSPEDQIRGAQTVGSNEVDTSPFGAFDMAGNVAEWVEAAESSPAADFAAGGSYLAIEAAQFRVDFIRAVPKGACAPDTGFRVLIELPAE